MFQKHLSCMVSGSKLEETYPAGPSNSQENFLGNQSLLLVCTLQPTQNQLEPCLAWCGLITGWRVQAVKCLRVEESLDCGCGHISPFPLGRTGGNKATATSPPLPFLWYSVQKRLVWARNLERGIFVKVKDFREVSIVHHSNYWWKAVIRDGATQHSTLLHPQGYQHCLFLCLYFCSWWHGFNYHLKKIRKDTIQSAIPQPLVLVLWNAVYTCFK